MRHLALASVLLFAVACATTGNSKLQTSSSGPEQRFTMVGSGIQTDALISKTGAQGPEINVGRYDDGKTIRGTVNGRTIDMSVTGTLPRASGGRADQRRRRRVGRPAEDEGPRRRTALDLERPRNRPSRGPSASAPTT
jgi:hypothetical protein